MHGLCLNRSCNYRSTRKVIIHCTVWSYLPLLYLHGKFCLIRDYEVCMVWVWYIFLSINLTFSDALQDYNAEQDWDNYSPYWLCHWCLPLYQQLSRTRQYSLLWNRTHQNLGRNMPSYYCSTGCHENVYHLKFPYFNNSNTRPLYIPNPCTEG